MLALPLYIVDNLIHNSSFVIVKTLLWNYFDRQQFRNAFVTCTREHCRKRC